ncbi:DUF4190 domain-containing protein, partial [Acidobacteriota bacterium]
MNNETGVKQTSMLAVVSMILGLLSMFLCASTGFAAVVLGHLSLGRIKRSSGTLGGRGMALTGLILGYVSILVFIVILAVSLFAPFLLDNLKNAMNPPNYEMTMRLDCPGDGGDEPQALEHARIVVEKRLSLIGMNGSVETRPPLELAVKMSIPSGAGMDSGIKKRLTDPGTLSFHLVESDHRIKEEIPAIEGCEIREQ